VSATRSTGYRCTVSANCKSDEIEGNGTDLADSRHANSLPEPPPRLHPDVHPGGQRKAYERADEDEGDNRVRELVV
jgi:hypothetical protein